MRQKNKILFPIGSFYPAQLGGPSNSIYFLAKELVKKGFDIFIFTSSNGLNGSQLKLNSWIQIDGFNVFYSSVKTKSGPLLLNPGKLIETLKPDLIFLTSIFTPLSQIFSKLARRNKIPYLWSPRGEFLDWALSYKKIKKYLLFKTPVFRKNILNSFIHVTSDSEKEHFIKNFKKNAHSVFPKDRIFVIPNIADDELFVKGRILPANKPYILFLGRIARIKNLNNLILAYHKSEIYKNKNLIIAGAVDEDINYYKELQILISNLKLSNYVVFTKERVEGNRKKELIQNSELLLLPSFSENFGMVVLESLALGVPVLASKNTPWNIIENYGGGYYVNTDKESISIALINFEKKTNDEKNILRENAIKIAERFRSSIIIPAYLNLINSILNMESNDKTKF